VEKLFLEATTYTPEIDFNTTTHYMKILGKSYPENTFEFYQPILVWLDKYFKSILDETVVFHFEIEYLNSSSLNAQFDILDLLEEMSEAGKNIQIKWIYNKNNDLLEEIGEDFQTDFKTLNIELIKKD
jgi:hypothetical protein